jgi:Mg2+/Co2+ transporter CorC
MANRKNDLGQWWLPVAETAIASAFPVFGGSLPVVRGIATSKDLSRKTRSDLSELYVVGLTVGIVGFLLWLDSRNG